MSIPLWVLLAFACWTLAVLMVGVGIRRWTLILSGQAQLTDFPGDTAHGAVAYRRAVRAHANCVENLPVYGAIALVANAAQVTGATMDAVAIGFLGARILQSIVHMAFVETNATVFVRFTFFFTQIVAMSWMAWQVTLHAPGLTL